MKIARKIVIALLVAVMLISGFMLVRNFVNKSGWFLKPLDDTLSERFGDYTPTDLEQEIYDLLSAAREEQGLAPLRFESGLHELSLIRAKEAAEFWSHTRPDGRECGTVFEDYELGVYFECVGENLGRQFNTADMIHEALMNSDGHRKNILSEEYDGVSIAVYTDADGNNYLCQTFVKRR